MLYGATMFTPSIPPIDLFSVIQTILIPSVGWLLTIANRTLSTVRKIENRQTQLELLIAEQEKQHTEHVRHDDQRFAELREDLRYMLHPNRSYEDK